MQISRLAGVVLSTLVTATAAEDTYGLEEECLWSPLLRWNDLKCAATSLWVGPQECLGEYCIYSNDRFGGGIVLITNEESARRAAKYPFMEEIHLDEPPYYQAEVPGKGRGLVANRTIRRGESISLWPPAVVVQLDLHMNVSVERRIEIYEKAVRKLPARRKQAFVNQMGEDVNLKVDLNAFHMSIDTGTEAGLHLGCFPEAALYNHDCRPNMHYRIKNMTHAAVAVRDIAPGEELSISYIDAALTRTERIERLADWGFNCSCKQCSMSDSKAAESDARLREIKQTTADLDAGPDGHATADTGGYLVSLYEKERLHIYLGHAYTRAALNYALFAEEENAREYATKAIEALEIEFGQSGDLPSMRDLAANPRRHWSWGLMKKRRMKNKKAV